MIRAIFVVFLVLALASALAAAGDAAAGKAIFDKTCKSCHGATGQGNPAIAKSLGVTLHPLASAEVQKKTDAELKKSMVGGFGKKKPLATKLTDKQMDDVVAFVRTLK